MEKELLEKITIEQKEGSTAVLTGELPFTELEKHKPQAIEALAKQVKVDGFRDGKVPENILVQKVGEMALLTEMAERALSKTYPSMVEHFKLDVIGYPQISITKIAQGNPLGFTITIATVPEVTLPDYEKIAKEVNAKKESKEITDADVDKQIEDILRQKAAYERMQEKAAKKSDDTEENDGHVHGPNCNHDEDKEEDTEKPLEDKVNAEGGQGESSPDKRKSPGGEGPLEDIKDLPLPELTDDLVKTLGQPGQFETVADFKAKLKEHLTIEKAREVDSAHRAKLTDAIIEESKLDLPKVLVDAEIGQMFAHMEEDLKRAQLNMDDYLEHIKKTKEDLKNEWTPAAEKRAKLQLVLNAIAKQDDIKPDPSLVDTETDRLMEQHKDADRARVKTYIESVLTNDAVMKKLEEAK